METSRMINGRILPCLLLCASVFCISAFGQGRGNNPVTEPQVKQGQADLGLRRTKLNELLASVRRTQVTPIDPKEERIPRVRKIGREYVYWASAPRGAQFDVEGAAGKEPAEVADLFVTQWRTLLTRDDPRIGFQRRRVRQMESRNFVRYKQTISGLEVHASTLIVQVNRNGGVETLVNDVMHDAVTLTSVQPTLDRQAGEDRAIQWMREQYGQSRFQATPAELVVYSPLVVGRVGDIQLTWRTEVSNADDSSLKERVLVNAVTGEIAFHHTLIFHALSRSVHDNVANNTRTENDGHTGFHDEVNRAFDYLGDTYRFYWDNCEQRDSWNDDGGTGTPPNGEEIAWVRLGTWAWWNNGRIELGPGSVTDDTIGHEFTHGVTNDEIGSTYDGESAAIKESLCDMWGEWIDQTYNHDTSYDTPIYQGNVTFNDDNDVNAAKWLLFEDDTAIPANLNPWRRMDDPKLISTNYSGYGSDFNGTHSQPDYRPDMPFDTTDFPWDGVWYIGNQDSGGAHHNLGVGNKLCFLLTEGQSGFRGQYDVSGFGMPKAASLFYKGILLLPDGCDYYDLYFALSQAAINLNFSWDDCVNVKEACEAVGIVPTTDVGDWALEGHWELDETIGDEAEDSVGNNDGEVTEADWATGHFNGALDFNGSTDYVELNAVDALKGRSASISAWIKPGSVASGYHPIMTQYANSGGNQGYYLCLNGNEPAFYLNDAPGCVSSIPVDTTEWYHIVGTYNGLALKIYVDGVLTGEPNAPGEDGYNGKAYIGSSGGTSYFKGLIDDVKVFNYALGGPNEVKGIMYPRVLSVRTSSTPTVAWIDNQGNLFSHGTVQKDPSIAADPSSDDEAVVLGTDGVVAIFNMVTGDITVKGDIHAGYTIPIDGGSHFVVRNETETVAYIDASGNFYFEGQLYENTGP